MIAKEVGLGIVCLRTPEYAVPHSSAAALVSKRMAYWALVKHQQHGSSTTCCSGQPPLACVCENSTLHRQKIQVTETHHIQRKRKTIRLSDSPKVTNKIPLVAQNNCYNAKQL